MTPAELIHAILLAPGRPALERRHRHLRQGLHRGPPLDRRPRQRRDPGRRQGPAGQGRRRGRQPRPDASSAASRPRSAACGSTPTPSTTPPASTPPTTRSTSRSCSARSCARATLTTEQRNELLASMTDDVAAARAARQLRAERPARQRPRAGARRWRASTSASSTGSRTAATSTAGSSSSRPTPRSRSALHDGLGLKSPEFSVLVAYAKLALKEDILASSIPDDPYFERTLADYFPPAIRETYAAELAEHPLRREIVTNSVVNSMVNRGGITFAFRAQEEAGATPEQVTRAFVVCREVFGLADYVREVEALDNVVPTAAQTGALPRVPPAARPLGAVVPHVAALDARHRRRDRALPRRRAASSARRCPTCCAATSASASTAGPPSSSRRACPTSSRLRAAMLLDWYSAARHRRHRRRDGPRAGRRRAAVLPRVRALRHRLDAQQGQRACRATTAGTPWPAARCATTCTPCSSR